MQNKLRNNQNISSASEAESDSIANWGNQTESFEDYKKRVGKSL